MSGEWPEITAARKDGYDYTEYTRNSQKLIFQPSYQITVEPGDSLSRYSMILYGDFKQLHVFMRPKDGTDLVYDRSDLKEIADKNLIRVGETLYHLPTVVEYNTITPPVAVPTLPTLPPPAVILPHGMEIVAYDSYDLTGWGEWATTWGSVNFTDVPSFVAAVQGKLAGRKLSILHIQVHGGYGGHGMRFGDPHGGGDIVTSSNFARFVPDLKRLKPDFAANAWVVVRACKVGRDLPLLRQFQKLWNVNIFAGEGDWNNLIDYNEELYVVLKTDGSEFRTSAMPNQIQHSTMRVWSKNR